MKWAKHGFEWPAPGAPDCGARAQDRATGRRISCNLRKGHASLEHHWQEVHGDQLLSASWIATGHVTMIGEPPRSLSSVRQENSE